MTTLVYEVSVKGALSEPLRAAFDCEVRVGHGVSVLRCSPDLLASTLERLESFGLELLDVRLVAEPTADELA
jgi:hypothetical protein